MRRVPCALVVFLAFAMGVRGDEIRLKDGSKIVGTIVDFENDSFKVQTIYGFALVRKDSIAQIIPSEPVRPAEPAKTAAAATGAAATSSPVVRPEARPAATTAGPGSATAAPAASRSATAAPAAANAAAAAPAAPGAVLPMPAPNPRPAPSAAVPAAAAPATPAAAPAAASAPAAPMAPAPVRERVQGNLYTNETYAFQFYRPPGWELIPEARRALPNAITAMGTGDETTLFVVGRETLRDSLEAHTSASERALRRIYENYRPLSLVRRTVAGLPAVEWRFRGVADGRDWSVTVLALARGNDVFTLLGMTYADSDLIQIRENVIAKMLSSVQFTSAP
jgi:hypothetical protein